MSMTARPDDPHPDQQPPPARTVGVPAWWRWLAIGLALVTVALAVLLVVGRDRKKLGESAQGSAKAACELLSQVPRAGFEIYQDSGRVDVFRIASAEALGMLAAQQDSSLESLSEALRVPRNLAVAQFQATGPEWESAMDEATSACKGLD